MSLASTQEMTGPRQSATAVVARIFRDGRFGDRQGTGAAEDSAAGVGGYSIGADPIVTSIALLSFQENNPIPAFIIRKEEKLHGTGKIIEGNFPKKGTVAIFDDVVTSGGSILRGANQVEQQGSSVEVIMAIIDREEGGREKIEAAGYKFYSIFTRKDLI